MGSLNLSRTFKNTLIFCETMMTSLNFVHVLQSKFVELEKDRWTKYMRRYFGDFVKLLNGAFKFTYMDAMKMLTAKLEKEWEVLRQIVGNKFSYTCMKMESFGLPCVHILAVLVRLEYTIIPNTLVIRRWSKTANDEDFKYYSHKVLTDTVCLEIKNNLRPADHVGVTAEKRVKDPISVRAIGTGRFSQASALTEKKRRKCSKCGRLNHRRTHCLNRASQEGGQSCAGVNKRVVLEDAPSNNSEAVSLGNI
ncbi:hypothetical protein Ahy_B07g086677 [Arachis hypogaea]|uniref:Protein FAR1-RELATED SEQUENCE n=1 Tax=Arachis hypogaea TaxID=3818 RepID=A0A444YA79_ARAHY|nr:hypothetical protein Ahy_B07g086677 [Arachis hypogaea]